MGAWWHHAREAGFVKREAGAGTSLRCSSGVRAGEHCSIQGLAGGDFVAEPGGLGWSGLGEQKGG